MVASMWNTALIMEVDQMLISSLIMCFKQVVSIERYTESYLFIKTENT